MRDESRSCLRREIRTNTARGIVIASAAATLIIAGDASLRADVQQTQKSTDDKVMCEGINECAGKGSCAGSHGDCAGMNSCRGKGVVSATYKDCVCKGGKVVEERTAPH